MHVHGLGSSLIAAQSQAIGIPIVQREVTWETYEKEFKSVICGLKQSGVEGAVFGDICNITGHEGWIDRVCSELDIKPVKPLWDSDPEQLLTDFIDEGFEAIVVMVKADLLSEEWLGRKVDRNFVGNLLRLESKFHLCGELGEYHTFVSGGPLFKRRLEILDSKKILKNGYWFLYISMYNISRK